MQEKYNITDAELEIMQVLWKKKQCNLTTIIEELSNNEEKNKNTITINIVFKNKKVKKVLDTAKTF